MNKKAKKLFSAAVIVCLSISSVAAYAAQITPSSTSITLGKNDTALSVLSFENLPRTVTAIALVTVPSGSKIVSDMPANKPFFTPL